RSPTGQPLVTSSSGPRPRSSASLHARAASAPSCCSHAGDQEMPVARRLASCRVPLRPQPVTTNRSSTYGRQHPAQLGDPLHLCAPSSHVLIRPQLLRPLPRPPAGRLVWPRHGQRLQRPPPPAQILTIHEDPCLAQVLLQPWCRVCHHR